MKTFSISMVSVLAMTGFALAQGAAGSAAKPAGGAAKAPAGAGSAAAPAGGAKAAAGAGAGSAAAPAGAAAPKMEMPKPPAEIAATAKMMKKMNCTGEGMGPDMKMAKAKGSAGPAKVDLDGWWITHPITMTMGEGKAAAKLKIEQHMTYDAKTSKWKVLGFSNDGGTMVGTADMKDGKYEFVGEMSGAMGTMAFKDHGDMTDPKNIKFSGEASMDKGKTWTKVYEITCK